MTQFFMTRTRQIRSYKSLFRFNIVGQGLGIRHGEVDIGNLFVELGLWVAQDVPLGVVVVVAGAAGQEGV